MDTSTSAVEVAFKDATQRVGLAYAIGETLDKIQAQEHDRSAWLLNEAQTDDGRAHATEYDQTADTLIADLRADEAEAGRIQPEAGTPHPDATMAARGWQMGRTGVWVKGEFDSPAAADSADVAALERYAVSLRDADRAAG